MMYHSYLLLLCLFLFGSCVEEEKVVHSSRTVLFYLATDNSLSSEADEKMNALASGWVPEWGELLFYIDRIRESPRLYRAIGAGKVEVVKTYEESNAASPAVLSSVIDEVATRYPADSYGLIFFSHASGWLPQGTLVTPRSIGMDGVEEMELDQFAAAIPDGMFRFILFEACFMGGVEVAYALKEKADYLLVSPAEIVSPGFTPIYGQAVGMLFKRCPDLIGFGRSYAEYCDRQEGYLRSRTLSLIETAQIDELAQAMKGIHMEVAEVTPPVQYFDRTYGYHLYLDFAQWAALHSDARQGEEVKNRIDRCVVWKDASPEFMRQYNGFEIKSYSGLTTYTTQRRFPVLNAAYSQTRWYSEVLNKK